MYLYQRNEDKHNPEALSQLYKMMNYKPQTGKGERLTTDQVANFLKLNKKGSESEMYDDIIYYDEAKIKVFTETHSGTCPQAKFFDCQRLL